MSVSRTSWRTCHTCRACRTALVAKGNWTIFRQTNSQSVKSRTGPLTD